ncbi:MAG TPA: YceI family protein [Acidimicrobiales bacterium]|jgi:polyisoprenoid-binding protein YceI|nr:YceI family protein [Acidimicrobiales bacterium]
MSDTTVTSRTIDGVELPAAGTYVIDEAHTHVGFAVRHMAVSKVRGRFGKVDGTLVVGEDPTESSVQVSIDANSVDTRDETRDNHVRTADFLDVENHPAITFTSTAVRPSSPGSWQVDGGLTIRGTTRPVVLDVNLEGVVQDPYGNHRVGFSATTEINRDDFGVSFGAVMEAGGLVVAKKVTIEIEAEAVYQA